MKHKKFRIIATVIVLIIVAIAVAMNQGGTPDDSDPNSQSNYDTSTP